MTDGEPCFEKNAAFCATTGLAGDSEAVDDLGDAKLRVFRGGVVSTVLAVRSLIGGEPTAEPRSGAEAVEAILGDAELRIFDDGVVSSVLAVRFFVGGEPMVEPRSGAEAVEAIFCGITCAASEVTL